MKKEPIRIFLIEDDEGDVRITKEAFEDGKLLVDMIHFETANLALAAIQDGERPDLILLDLNLPGMDGRELLNILKGDPEYASIPIVILTTSKSEEDIIKSYQQHCPYITKPMNAMSFNAVARSIENFWFQVVKIAPESDTGEPDGQPRTRPPKAQA